MQPQATSSASGLTSSKELSQNRVSSDESSPDEFSNLSEVVVFDPIGHASENVQVSHSKVKNMDHTPTYFFPRSGTKENSHALVLLNVGRDNASKENGIVAEMSTSKQILMCALRGS
jgi:hypothetical protein